MWLKSTEFFLYILPAVPIVWSVLPSLAVRKRDVLLLLKIGSHIFPVLPATFYFVFEVLLILTEFVFSFLKTFFFLFDLFFHFKFLFYWNIPFFFYFPFLFSFIFYRNFLVFLLFFFFYLKFFLFYIKIELSFYIL